MGSDPMVKIETFRDVCSVKKSIFLTFVTSAGLADNAQRNMVQSEVTLDDFSQILRNEDGGGMGSSV